MPEENRSLSERVNDLISVLGDIPAPAPYVIKNSLAELRVEISDLEYDKEQAESEVQALEKQKAALQKEKENLEAVNRAQIEELEAVHKTELEELSSMREAHHSELKAKNDQLRAANADLAKVLAKNKVLEEKINPDDRCKEQKWILRFLPPPEGTEYRFLEEIVNAIGSATDETVWHLHKLTEDQLVESLFRAGGKAWRRSPKGNNYLLIRRNGGDLEAQEPPKINKFADLPPLEHSVLITLLKSKRENVPLSSLTREMPGGAVTLQHVLLVLKRKAMVDLKPRPNGDAAIWVIEAKGGEYLSERGLLGTGTVGTGRIKASDLVSRNRPKTEEK